MKILKMTATFGCLDQAVLELRDGVNLLCLPNESGKTTWAAFLLAMFYGVDTSQRAARGKLPVKTRYQPWSGKPMAGAIHLEHNGQQIVLQRTSERGKPMGVFRAYDPRTGLDLPGLTGETCGRVLLGVEQSVFQRSAFLSGSELAVTQDRDLARRLANLAASGREADSYVQAEGALKLWQNRCRYHSSGLIPETAARLRQTEETLVLAEDLRRQRLERMGEQTRLAREADRLEQQHREAGQEKRLLLRNALEQAHIRAEAKASQTALLPPQETLLRLQARLEQADSRPLGEGACPPALEGLPAEAVWPKVRRSVAEYDRLTAREEKNTKVWLLLAVLALAAAVGAALLQAWLPFGCLAALTLTGLAGWVRNRRHNRVVCADREAAGALLESYGAAHKEQLMTVSLAWRDHLLAVNRAERQAWETDLVLEEVRAFAPAVETAEQAGEALRQALQLQKQAADAQRELERAQYQWQNAGPPAPDPGVEQRRRRCAHLRGEIGSLSSREQALGGWEQLDARRQQLARELEELTRREQALQLARQALAAANDQLAQVYAPQLTRLAGDYLCWLTGGRYDGLVMKQELELLVRENATGLTRPLAALSRGAQDQTWLAVRLAMTKLLLPEGAPLVLDDALLTFDKARELAALEVLEMEKRQILLFSCR